MADQKNADELREEVKGWVGELNALSLADACQKLYKMHNELLKRVEHVEKVNAQLQTELHKARVQQIPTTVGPTA